MYGFQTKAERDLFRKLIGVSGIGPQMGMALLEELQLDELILSIVQQDIHALSKAQGVGKRTAERLAIELSHKLSEFDVTNHLESMQNNKKHHEPPFSPSIINELHETLRSVGYEDDEIRSAIKAIGTKFDSKNKSENQDLTRPIDDIECLLKASLLWLSNDSK